MRSVVVTGTGVAREGRPELEDLFPRRWNRRRPLHEDARPLVDALASALVAAGWWEPGTGYEVAGGLFVGVDHQAAGPAARFAAALDRDDAASRRPTDFLFALPSSTAAAAGVCFGLRRHQSVLVRGGTAGIAALGHAVDAIALGRVERLAVAALTVTAEPALRLAVAWCLEAGAPTGGLRIERAEALGVGAEIPAEARASTDGLLDDVAPAARSFAAPGLLAATRLFCENGACGRLVLRHDADGEVGLVTASSSRS